MNDASARWSVVIATVHVGAAPAGAQAPVQPANTDPGAAAPVTVSERAGPK
jgi:hypothetical protein